VKNIFYSHIPAMTSNLVKIKKKLYKYIVFMPIDKGGRHGRDRMVAGFTTTYHQ
jgi:hypothetical protein